jgi:peptide/nickel transport system substrate-binding protein
MRACKKRRWITIAVFLSLCIAISGARSSLLAAATVDPKAKSIAIKKGGVLRIGHKNSAFNLDPHKDTGQPGIYVLNQITEGLLRANGKGEIVPALAVSMPELADGKDYIFTLRKGVKFHDGTEFKAEHVKYSFDRLLDPKRSAIVSRVQEFIEGVTVINDYRVRIKMKQPWVDFIPIMAFDKIFNIIHTSADGFGKDYGAKAGTVIGTGPFKLQVFEPSDRAEVVRFDQYWDKGKPYLDRIIFREIPEDATRNVAFRSGDIDVNLDVEYKDIEQLKKEKNTLVYSTGGGISHQINFNTGSKPFDDKRVRQALSMAINREELAKVTRYGYAEPATSNFPSWNIGFDPAASYKAFYNPEKAKALLAEAGFGPKKPLEFKFMVREGYMDPAVMVQHYWDQIGVKTQLESVEARALVSLQEERKYQVAYVRLGFGPPPTEWTYRSFSGKSYLNRTGYNKEGFKNPHAEDLMVKAAVELDPKKAKVINIELARILFTEDIPSAMLFYEDNVDIVKDYVKNWGIISLDYLPRTDVWLDK